MVWSGAGSDAAHAPSTSCSTEGSDDLMTSSAAEFLQEKRSLKHLQFPVRWGSSLTTNWARRQQHRALSPRSNAAPRADRCQKQPQAPRSAGTASPQRALRPPALSPLVIPRQRSQGSKRGCEFSRKKIREKAKGKGSPQPSSSGSGSGLQDGSSKTPRLRLQNLTNNISTHG